jgi:hypothetical protein
MIERTMPPVATIRFFAVTALAMSAAPVFSNTNVPAFSPDIHWSDGQTVVADEQAASGTVLQNLFGAPGLPASADVNAMHGLPDGGVLFSLETTLELGGIVFRPNDVIRFDGESWSKALDGRAAGIPDGVGIDALAMSGENLLFSIDVGASLGGALAVTDADIVAWNGAVFSMVLLSGDAGIDAAADVDALHVDGQGRLLMSFDTAGQVGGINYRDEDLLMLDSSTWSMEIDNSAVAWQPVDLDAWSVVFLDDLLFIDGFEAE